MDLGKGGPEPLRQRLASTHWLGPDAHVRPYSYLCLTLLMNLLCPPNPRLRSPGVSLP